MKKLTILERVVEEKEYQSTYFSFFDYLPIAYSHVDKFKSIEKLTIHGNFTKINEILIHPMKLKNVKLIVLNLLDYGGIGRLLEKKSITYHELIEYLKPSAHEYEINIERCRGNLGKIEQCVNLRPKTDKTRPTIIIKSINRFF